uniref:Uncharacterized protein n=1 Tax=Ditylenchus dipsaci TaxID=166011 RepID=A0A915CR38_9BILA
MSREVQITSREEEVEEQAVPNNNKRKKLLSLIPNFTVPSRYQLNKLMKEELDEMLKVLIQLIKNSPGLSISADIGTTRNNRLSFLLLMVHVFDIKAGRPLTYALDIMHLRERHTGEYIARPCHLLI